MTDLWRLAAAQAERIQMLKHQAVRRQQIRLLLRTLGAAIRQSGAGATPRASLPLPGRRQPDLFL